MNKLLLVTALSLCGFAAHAQVGAAAGQQQGGTSTNEVSSTATAGATNAGNAQSITFTAPAATTSTMNGTTTLNGTTTQNQNLSGGTNSTITNLRGGVATERVEYDGSYTVKNVPSVNGPNLTTSNDTCMGSTSGSANGPGFGIGFGTTWVDENCKNLKMSRELWNKGMKAASLAVDCENSTARKALEMTGSKCPQSMTADERKQAFGQYASAEGAVSAPVVATAGPAPAEPVAANRMYSGNDPIVMARLGMTK